MLNEAGEKLEIGRPITGNQPGAQKKKRKKLGRSNKGREKAVIGMVRK